MPGEWEVEHQIHHRVNRAHFDIEHGDFGRGRGRHDEDGPHVWGLALGRNTTAAAWPPLLLSKAACIQ